jgi:hypothetical protein
MEEFHNKFLSQGMPPIKIVRRKMLGNDSPVHSQEGPFSGGSVWPNHPSLPVREKTFAAWYQDVVLQGDMAEPAEIVKGCMVIKPNGYAVWEVLQRELDAASKPPAIRTSTSRC